MSEIEKRDDVLDVDAAGGVPAAFGGAMDVPPGLARRLSQAIAAVEPLVLDGENKFHNFRYPTIGQVRGAAGRALASAGIAILPTIERVGRTTGLTASGKEAKVTVVEIVFTITSEDGSVSLHWIGESEDTSDKGVSKAIASATKSFLTSLLCIPVESDEEPPTTRHAPAQRPTAAAQAPRPQAQQPRANQQPARGVGQ